MKDNKPPSGQVVLPEYQNLAQIFNTLCEHVRATGTPNMGTFLIQDDMGGIMVVGKMREIIHLSRILATIGQTPLVRMEGQGP